MRFLLQHLDGNPVIVRIFLEIVIGRNIASRIGRKVAQRRKRAIRFAFRPKFPDLRKRFTPLFRYDALSFPREQLRRLPGHNPLFRCAVGYGQRPLCFLLAFFHRFSDLHFSNRRSIAP